ncbi:general stress protein [Paenibacillus humicola]|uniref:general stress protein n=1 Tax=Paenibacillus humicola TaxID=3110540 RepID=UPI00237B859D|nr:general stress protein [Paenibacillus humicola]
MALQAGVFRKEQQAIEAVQALEAEGFARTGIHVFAKNIEHTRRIESETDVHADEVQELTETRDESGEGGRYGLPGFVSAPLSTAAGFAFLGNSPGVSSSTPYNGAGVFAAAGMLDGESNMEQSLRALGLDEETAGVCGKAIAEGSIVVAADVDGGSSDGGPDLSSGGRAEAVFRRCGAERIL